MKKGRFIGLIAPAAALIMAILPYGAVLNFISPDGEPCRHTYSYFSLTPLGYANVGPFLTAILTCILLITAIIYFAAKKKTAIKLSAILSCAAFATSLLPLFLGIEFFSAVGAAISLSMLINGIFWFVKWKTAGRLPVSASEGDCKNG